MKKTNACSVARDMFSRIQHKERQDNMTKPNPDKSGSKVERQEGPGTEQDKTRRKGKRNTDKPRQAGTDKRRQDKTTRSRFVFGNPPAPWYQKTISDFEDRSPNKTRQYKQDHDNNEEDRDRKTESIVYNC